MNTHSYVPNSPKSFPAYPRRDFDLESGLGTIRRPRKPRSSSLCSDPFKMLKSIGARIRYYYKLHPLLVLTISLCFGVLVLIILSIYEFQCRNLTDNRRLNVGFDNYPYPKLKNLLMVAGHSVYTCNSCGDVDNEESWFLESYQKRPGQAASFVIHIKEGVEIAAKDDAALLLFSGGETQKDAGPRSEAQSYWAVADSKGWFGDEESVRWRALTEEHARDSFENLLFSVCRFRELTGTYPTNITVVSYDFKEDRFCGSTSICSQVPGVKVLLLGHPSFIDRKRSRSQRRGTCTTTISGRSLWVSGFIEPEKARV